MQVRPRRYTKQQLLGARKRMARRWLRYIVQAGEITEVFVKYARGGGLQGAISLIGYYDDEHLIELVEDVFAHFSTAQAIYYRLNAVRPEALERSANRLQTVKR